jgi:hypothetical protein
METMSSSILAGSRKVKKDKKSKTNKKYTSTKSYHDEPLHLTLILKKTTLALISQP